MRKIFSIGRSRILFFLFALWAFVLLFRLFEIAVLRQDEYITKCESIARRKGVVPASRGKILDCNGIQLAWSERYYDLSIDVASLPSRKSHLPDEIRGALLADGLARKENFLETSKKFTVRNLSPEAIERLKPYVRDLKSAVISPRLERKSVDYRRVMEILGRTENEGDMLVGVSGIEKERNDELAGHCGLYSIMLDRGGGIIQGTLKIEKEMLPGKDIKLERSLDEMTGGAR